MADIPTDLNAGILANEQPPAYTPRATDEEPTNLDVGSGLNQSGNSGRERPPPPPPPAYNQFHLVAPVPPSLVLPPGTIATITTNGGFPTNYPQPIPFPPDTEGYHVRAVAQAKGLATPFEMLSPALQNDIRMEVQRRKCPKCEQFGTFNQETSALFVIMLVLMYVSVGVLCLSLLVCFVFLAARFWWGCSIETDCGCCNCMNKYKRRRCSACEHIGGNITILLFIVLFGALLLFEIGIVTTFCIKINEDRDESYHSKSHHHYSNYTDAATYGYEETRYLGFKVQNSKFKIQDSKFKPTPDTWDFTSGTAATRLYGHGSIESVTQMTISPKQLKQIVPLGESEETIGLGHGSIESVTQLTISPKQLKHIAPLGESEETIGLGHGSIESVTQLTKAQKKLKRLLNKRRG